MTFSDTAMMELVITQSTDTHSKRSLIRTSYICQRLRAAGRNQQVEGYTHTRTHEHAVNVKNNKISNKKRDFEVLVLSFS